MRGRMLGLFPLLFALTLVAAACGGGGGGGGASPKASASEEEGGQITLGGQTANDHGSADVSSKDEFDLEQDNEGSSYYFDPTVLQGTPGQKIELNLENEGSVEHNFTLTQQGIDQDVEPGEKAKVDVTFPQSGQLVFFCKYHRQLGMLGALQAGS